MKRLPKVGILYTVAGGGHINVARALESSFKKQYGISPDLLDLIKTHAPTGFKEPDKIYKWMLKYGGKPHEWLIKASESESVLTPVSDAFYLMINKDLKKFVKENDYDLLIGVHPVYAQLFDRMKYGMHVDLGNTKLVTVVTDIAYMIRAWFSEGSDLTILPSLEAFGYGFRYFKKYIPQIEVMGLPIQEKWFETYDKEEIRKELGIEKDKKTVLLFGGGEGSEKVLDILKRLEKECSNINIFVATGRDENMKSKILKKKYINKVEVVPWTDVFHKYVIASDIIISKAGPTLMWECMTIKKPLIVFDYIKGQEEGNQDFVENHSIGKYLKKPKDVAKYVSTFKVSGENIITSHKKNYASLIVDRCMKLL